MTIETVNVKDKAITLLKIIDRFTDVSGRAIAWLTVAMVMIVMVVVVTRYFLEVGSIALQESVTYLHCMIFMLGLAFTLQHDGHVRVDIFYRDFSTVTKAKVDFVGGVFFLIPICLLLLIMSWDYVMASWSIKETSAENNGLPFVYLLKTLMLIMPMTLLMQGIAETVKNAIRIFKPESTLGVAASEGGGPAI